MENSPAGRQWEYLRCRSDAILKIVNLQLFDLFFTFYYKSVRFSSPTVISGRFTVPRGRSRYAGAGRSPVLRFSPKRPAPLNGAGERKIYLGYIVSLVEKNMGSGSHWRTAGGKAARSDG